MKCFLLSISAPASYFIDVSLTCKNGCVNEVGRTETGNSPSGQEPLHLANLPVLAHHVHEGQEDQEEEDEVKHAFFALLKSNL